MKLFLDDQRTAPPVWKHVYWPKEAIEFLKTGQVTEISLDHDLGDDSIGTGYDVIVWIERQIALNGFIPPKIYVHSANVSAKEKMLAGIKKIEELNHENNNKKISEK